MSVSINTVPAEDIRPIHQPFTWVPSVADSDRDAHLAALTLDVCNGVQTCLQLVHATDMAVGAGGDDQPLLGTLDKEHLLLLATAATRMLAKQAYDRVDYLNDQARKAAAAGQRGAA